MSSAIQCNDALAICQELRNPDRRIRIQMALRLGEPLTTLGAAQQLTAIESTLMYDVGLNHTQIGHDVAALLAAAVQKIKDDQILHRNRPSILEMVDAAEEAMAMWRVAYDLPKPTRSPRPQAHRAVPQHLPPRRKAVAA